MCISERVAPEADAASAPVSICRVGEGGPEVRDDLLAVEEPLEIRLRCETAGKPASHNVSVTMRTPGQDRDLAVGFLFTEGILTSPDQVAGVHRCKGGNVVRVDLRAGVAVDLVRLERHFFTSSSCGVCGKAALAAVRVSPRYRAVAQRPALDAAVVHGFPAALRAAQATFDQTGGLHAAGLFDARGRLLCLREDVGRHNALDKLIGSEFMAGRLPLADSVLFVSGRTSFELVQKAAVAGIPIVAAVGAPSSLAVDLAREHGLTLLGFVREGHFNIYTGAERIRHAPALPPPFAPAARVPLAVV